MLNLTSGVVRWSPPPQQDHNGILLGYKIQVKAGNSSKILAQMTLNATTLSVGLHNLTTGATYNVRVVAYTRVGAGPFSKYVSFISCKGEEHFKLEVKIFIRKFKLKILNSSVPPLEN